MERTPRNSAPTESEWRQKVDFRFDVLAAAYQASLAFAVKNRGDRTKKPATKIEKTLITEVNRANVNLVLTQAVIAAQKAGEISVAVAERILTVNWRIAHLGQQLTLALQSRPTAAREQQEQARNLTAQIEHCASDLRILLQNKLKPRNSELLQVFSLNLKLLAIYLSGARLPLTLAPLLRPTVFRWFCWVKYQVSAEQLLQERDSGSLRAYERLAKIERLYYKWQYGILNFDDWKFRTAEVHTTLLLLGLCYRVDSLTQEELADCFDELCPCGHEHTPENLRKHLGRIRMKLALKDSDPLSPLDLSC